MPQRTDSQTQAWICSHSGLICVLSVISCTLLESNPFSHLYGLRHLETPHGAPQMSGRFGSSIASHSALENFLSGGNFAR